MKLRNKIDGTITEGDVWIKTKAHRNAWQCKSLEELNEHWEDYIPKEPLIKDEKIRKAVRAWAEADDLDNFRVQNQHFNECKIIGYTAGINKASFIGFQTTIAYADNTKLYTITELCGEVEAPEPLEPTFVDMDERTKEKEGQTKKNNITLGESESPDMVADFETGQVRLCAGDPYYDNFVSFKDFLGFAEELKEAMEEKE